MNLERNRIRSVRAKLQLTIGAVKSRLHRARRQIRSQLRDDFALYTRGI